MIIKELVELIASKHNIELSQTGIGLVVDSIDSNHGQLFLVPYYDENYHCIKCATKVDKGKKIIKLTLYFDIHWKLKKAIDDNTGLEFNNLIPIENQVNELITKYFLESRRVLHMQENALR